MTEARTRITAMARKIDYELYSIFEKKKNESASTRCELKATSTIR